MAEQLNETYEAAQTGCVLIDLTTRARVWSEGEHHIDLIDRMSTNDLKDMALNEARVTVLTNANARIVDVLVVLNLGARALLLGGDGRADTIRSWLSRYVFFNDDARFSDASAELGQFGLYGQRAGQVAESLASGAAELSEHRALLVGDAVLLRTPALAGGGFELIAPPDEIEAWRQRAFAAGAVLAPPALYDLLRVEAGRPGAGNELTEEFIPLEVGLWDAVSFNKGCYIGQEIIARMESRGRLAKTLIGLRAEAALPVGAQLQATDGSRGVVTSSVRSPRLGWLALGLLKPSAATPGAGVSVTHNGDQTSAVVSALPFE